MSFKSYFKSYFYRMVFMFFLLILFFCFVYAGWKIGCAIGLLIGRLLFPVENKTPTFIDKSVHHHYHEHKSINIIDEQTKQKIKTRLL